MAKAKKTADGVSDAAAATRAAIADRPRQSVTRYVQHYVTVRDAAPERIDELFGPEAEVLEANADKVTNPISAAIEKATKAQLELSIKALTNEDLLNGYAGYAFDQAVFDDKTRVKTPRTKRSVADKAEALFAEASEDDIATLAALLRARGQDL